MSKKTIKEIELEIELAQTRQQVIHLSIFKMQVDYASLDDSIAKLNNELAEAQADPQNEK